MVYGMWGARGLRDSEVCKGREGGVSDDGRSRGFFSPGLWIVAVVEVVGGEGRLSRRRGFGGWSIGGICSCRVLFAWRQRVDSERRRVLALKMS